MRKDRISGYTRVKFRVDENGDMMQIVSFSETTHEALKDSVRAVFKKWKLTEPKINGQRGKLQMELPIRFN